MDPDSVRIIVMDPCHFDKIKYETFTYKSVLCKLPKFKKWFDAVEIYKDYIEIGEEGYNGKSNLMLFDKYEHYPYMMAINCERYAHNLGMLTPPIITDIIHYCNTGEKPSEERMKLFETFLHT